MNTQPTPLLDICDAATKGPRSVDAVMGDHPLDVCLANPPPEQGNPVVIASTFCDDDDDAFITVEQATANAQLFCRLSPEVVRRIYDFVNVVQFSNDDCPKWACKEANELKALLDGITTGGTKG